MVGRLKSGRTKSRRALRGKVGRDFCLGKSDQKKKCWGPVLPNVRNKQEISIFAHTCIKKNPPPAGFVFEDFQRSHVMKISLRNH